MFFTPLYGVRNTDVPKLAPKNFPKFIAARLLADDPNIKPRHFGDIISTGKLLSPNVSVYFQIEMEN
jgi:hypothetical protein